MKVTKRKVMATVIACLVACMMFAMPVLAASSTYFSKSTTKLNAMGGGTSKTSTFSSGSVLGSNQSITQVKLALNVASGTDPYTIYVKSPEGTLTPITGSTSSTILYSNVFNGENPYGTWSVYIKNSGVTYNGNLIPTSTVTVSATVYYTYD